MTKKFEAVYTIVTPLFCSGGYPNRAELRPTSFKGVLRYWWRALAWSQCGGDLKKLQKQENELFGSDSNGQGKVLLSLEPPPAARSVPIGNVLTARDGFVVGQGARYLGYGVMEAFKRYPKNGRPGTEAGELTRACLTAPIEFSVRGRGRELEPDEIDSLKQALIATGTLGGMGAKSRKGYGSLVLRALRIAGEEVWTAPSDADRLRQAIADLHSPEESDQWPEITALSKRTRHVVLSSEEDDPLELLNLVGREMIRYRSWGQKGLIFERTEKSEKLFEDDHDLMDDKRTKKRTSHPRRIAFGLPHNYGRPNHKKVEPHDGQLDRRASPLFIHIHQCGAKPVAVLSFLPAKFLPKGKSHISVGGTRIPQTPEDVLYQPIHDFLERLTKKYRRPEGSDENGLPLLPIRSCDPEEAKRWEPFTDAREVTR